MAILGIESVIFGVEDLERCTRFWDDFGLVAVARTADESVFEVASGSKVVVRRKDDRRLPPAYFEGSGVRETVWGVDTPESLEKLVAGLAREISCGSRLTWPHLQEPPLSRRPARQEIFDH